MKGILVAAPHSRSGKTTITLGILRALAEAGEAVVPAKAGPDFIDPQFHAAASGKECVNLDPWAMRPELISALAARAVSGGGTLVVEAAMGLFDGAADGSGSAADLAAMLRLPVVLVVDSSRQSHSVGALVRGFRDHRPDVLMSGVIFNRVGSARHEAMLRSAVEALGIPVFGVVFRDENLVLPERHLGLVQAREHEDIEAFIAKAAETIRQSVDLARLVRVSSSVPHGAAAAAVPRIEPLGQHIAVARDDAFAFFYPHLLNGWRRQRAEISFFSPLADEGPDPGADAIYLPGGYPELHANALAEAANCRSALQRAAQSDTIIYGECGGYMAMGDGMIDAGGNRHRMLGLLPLETSFAERKRHLGYRQIRALPGSPFAGNYRGHEFHYAPISSEGKAERLFAVSDALGEELGKVGLRRGNVCGSFMHLIDRAAAT
jgi:cobyrinic acid a,c-diamide synthase